MIDKKCETFREMCEGHDITYSWSDDYKVYSRGELQYLDLVEYSKSIPRNLAVQIWNQTVEKKLRKEVWDEYKWK